LTEAANGAGCWQTEKRVARFKLFRQKYGDEWQEAMNMEQDPAATTTEQLREMFDMVDTDQGGALLLLPLPPATVCCYALNSWACRWHSTSDR
jgi:hypothetical protein